MLVSVVSFATPEYCGYVDHYSGNMCRGGSTERSSNWDHSAYGYFVSVCSSAYYERTICPLQVRHTFLSATATGGTPRVVNQINLSSDPWVVGIDVLNTSSSNPIGCRVVCETPLGGKIVTNYVYAQSVRTQEYIYIGSTTGKLINSWGSDSQDAFCNIECKVPCDPSISPATQVIGYAFLATNECN
jgi:hypothetical protein